LAGIISTVGEIVHGSIDPGSGLPRLGTGSHTAGRTKHRHAVGRIAMTVYEMRTYTLHVGKMAEAVKLYTEFAYPALQKGGQDKKLIG
jgi:hypothetical protein